MAKLHRAPQDTVAGYLMTDGSQLISSPFQLATAPLQVWRLLDPAGILIPAGQRRRRLSDRKRVKYLADVLEIGRHPLPAPAAEGMRAGPHSRSGQEGLDDVTVSAGSKANHKHHALVNEACQTAVHFHHDRCVTLPTDDAVQVLSRSQQTCPPRCLLRS